jgi:protein-tyrosine kinase
MSRIDEALKRISGETGQRITPSGRMTPRRMEDYAFDPYPSEPEPVVRRRVEGGDPTSELTHALAGESPIETGLTDASQGVNAIGDSECALRGNPTASQVERYRSIAGMLHRVRAERGLRTVIVTSAVPGEGRTLTAINLALALADLYACRVLLIDADRRQPSMHNALAVENYAGLSEALRGERRRISPTPVTAWLSVLTAGHGERHPFDDVTLDRMQALLEEFAGRFEWIVLDTPPVGIQWPDARQLVRLTQAAVFVIGAGSTPFPVVERAIEELGRDHVIATVMHGIDAQSTGTSGRIR